MEERLNVKQVFLRYVEALEKDDIEALGQTLSEDVVLESTNYGNATGRQAVLERLKWQGMPIDYSRYKIFDFVAFTQDGRASQSAVVTALVGITEPDYFHYFHFGGYYLNDYRKDEDGWHITHLRFNLDMEDGNSLLVRGWWKLIDYRYFEGAASYPIVSEVNNPWQNIPQPESLGSEEEQVLDAYYRYSWGIDHADFNLFLTCLDDEVYLFDDSHPQTREEIIRFMKYKRYKEAVMEHIWKIDSVKIEGNVATVRTRRYEPHRMGTTKFNIQNRDTDFYTGIFEYTFVKKPGQDYRDGGWKMHTNRVLVQKVQGETTHSEEKFF